MKHLHRYNEKTINREKTQFKGHGRTGLHAVLCRCWNGDVTGLFKDLLLAKFILIHCKINTLLLLNA